VSGFLLVLVLGRLVRRLVKPPKIRQWSGAKRFIYGKLDKFGQAIISSAPGALEEASGVISKVAEADEMFEQAKSLESKLAEIPADSVEFAEARLQIEAEAKSLRERAQKIHEGSCIRILFDHGDYHDHGHLWL
jgi:hypothetical protein